MKTQEPDIRDRAVPVYLNFAAKSFQAQLMYKFEYFIGVFNGLLYIFIFTSLWDTIYKAQPGAGGGYFTRQGIITYAVFAMIIRVSMTMEDNEITSRVRSGAIAMDLIKPVNYFLMNLSECFGETVFHWFARVTPIVIISVVSFDVALPASAAGYAMAIFAWVLGYMILFTMNFAFSMLAFWFIETFSFQLMKYGLLTMFSGSIMPVDFFPEWSKPLIALMPFQYIFYAPAAIFTGHISGGRAIELMTLQMAWLAALSGVCALMWNAARRKLVTQGG
ncbi:MAG: ABC-2 family transporter protein [Nitrospinae bacterium]|nr:ABC-2 family transporter protein [Nitrospinota bacterium]